jgi:cell division protein FtsB
MKYWDTPGRSRPFKPSEPTAPRHQIASGGDLRKYPFLRTFYEHQSEIGGGLQKFFFFVVIATLLYVFVLGDAGVLKIMALQKEKAQLVSEITTVRLDIDALQKEIDSLQKDSFLMEKLGRELYGYVAPGDKVIKLVPPTEGAK